MPWQARLAQRAGRVLAVAASRAPWAAYQRTHLPIRHKVLAAWRRPAATACPAAACLGGPAARLPGAAHEALQSYHMVKRGHVLMQGSSSSSSNT